MGRKWSSGEELIMLQFIEANKHWTHALPYLPDRSRGGVESKWFDMIHCGPRRLLVNRQGKPEDAHDINRKQDEMFQRAMRKAIKAGKEKAPIGVFKAPEDGEFRPKTFLPGLRTSGCSSSAALCAEVGDAKGAVW